MEIDRQMDRWTDRRVDRWMDGWMDGDGWIKDFAMTWMDLENAKLSDIKSNTKDKHRTVSLTCGI